MVKVRVFGKEEIKVVTIEEAQKLIDETYADEMGGLALDAISNEVIVDVSQDTKEIILMQQMFGGA
jgi:hypothetical protein